MKAWYWCPCCERAFIATAPEVQESPLKGLLQSLGMADPAPVACPYEDCAAAARVVMAWQALRRWTAKERGEGLPAVPVRGQRYPVPSASARQQAHA